LFTNNNLRKIIGFSALFEKQHDSEVISAIEKAAPP
jgi:hypothetical protein